MENLSSQKIEIEITDDVYKNITHKVIILAARQKSKLILDLKNSNCWYDFTIKIKDNPMYLRHYAGHVETENDSITDPFMAGLL
ncbi:Non-hemolytic phospholipase C precursor [compost metagenome]